MINLDFAKLERDENGAIVIPSPLERLNPEYYEHPKCPFCTWGTSACTHPLVPKTNIEDLRKCIVHFVRQHKTSMMRYKYCTLEDAEKCPLLEVMPLINFEAMNT